MKNIKADLFVLADYVSISQDGKLTIAGIFNKFFIENFPANYPGFYIAAVLNGDVHSKHNLLLTVKDPNGKDVLKQEFVLDFGHNSRANFITVLNNFPLNSHGNYEFKLKEGNNQISEMTVIVEKRKNEFLQKISKLPN